MKLFHTANSPYARRPRLAIRVFDMMGQVEEVDVAPLNAPDNILYSYGPGAKVPALLTDSGAFLCESLIITRHLDEASGGKFYPKGDAARGEAMQIEGVASLLMDSLFGRSHEKRRDPGEQSPAEIEKEAARAARCYDALEGLVDKFGSDLHMGTVTVITSLGYADGRHPDDGWRDGRPKITAWYEEMMKQPAMAETKPNFG